MRKHKKLFLLMLLFTLGGLLFSQSASLCGDVNDDGAVTIVDALLVSQVYVGANFAINMKAADVNNDGAVNIVDALSIARFYVGLIPVLQCPEAENQAGGIAIEEKEYLKTVESMSSELLKIKADEFLTQYPLAKDFKSGPDPTEAGFYKEMVQSFSLTSSQTALMRENGYVLLPPSKNSRGFGMIYRKVFREDLPVYVSADSILEPLFRSYDSLLALLERTKLTKQLSTILENTLKLSINDGNKADLSANTQQAISDVQFYLGVAQNLLNDSPPLGLPTEVQAKIDLFIKAINNESLQSIEFLGKLRDIDFSQFKPRGHYTCNSYNPKYCTLTKYFKTMMWLGRADCAFYLEEKRQLRAFFLLYDLLQRSKSVELINDFNDDISFFVGNIDGFSPKNMMTFWKAEMGQLTLGGVINNDKTAKEAQDLLAEKNYGNQFILSQAMWKAPGAPRPELPKIAQLSGQRFILDSYLLGRTVEWYVKTRNKPFLEEVAFSLGNNAAINVLKDDILKYDIVNLPDYKPLHARLGAMRYLFDYYPYWDSNLYTLWLDSLRQLSKPLPKTVPAAMRTSAWQNKQMNTQLASWSQLRHNTLLYAKQSYTGGVVCFYPDGYVDPYPAFYRTIGKLMKRMGEKLGSQMTSFNNRTLFPTWQKVTETLAEIAETELKGAPLTSSQLQFLNEMLVINPDNMCGAPEYIGWYPKLFYSGGWSDATTAKPVIADVHTIPPSIYSPSNMVLHGATGYPMVMILHAFKEGDNCGTLYAGPVFSYYQQDASPIKRFNNSEWLSTLNNSNPPQPEWIQKYIGN